MADEARGMLGVLQLNEHLAQITKQSVTTINVFVCLALNVPLGLVYHRLLHPRATSPVIRHLVGIILGFCIGWVCIGRVVFGVSFGIVIVAQTIRMVQSYGENIFDYTGRLMVLIQKYTYVAFCFHDGMARDKNDLNDWQQRQCLKKPPNLLEYFGYTFHFSSFLIGPSCTYREYINFIEGSDMVRTVEDSKGHNREPSPINALKGRSLLLVFCLLGTALFGPKASLKRNADPVFIANAPFLLRLLYSWVSMFVARLKYHTGFLLGEMAVISCGMGFTGFDKNGNEQWDNASFVNCYNVEFPTSLKMVVEGWNISTSKWLRRIIHDRVPYQKAAFTSIASLLWHGLYPGYFLITSSCFLCHEASKAVRRKYGHVYQELSPIGQKMLSVLLIFINILLLNYCIIPFPLLRFDLGIQFWRSMYFFGHILCGLVLVLLKLRKGPSPKQRDSVSGTKEAHILGKKAR